MNDIATIERALKDADRFITEYLTANIPPGRVDTEAVQGQITQALMLLRQIPGQHSPTTATRQAVVALENALRHYAELGPAKMKRKDLDLIRDAALTTRRPA